MLHSKHIVHSLILLISSSVFGQHATGYMPLPDGKYEETRIPFMSTGNQVTLPASYVISESYFPTPGSQGNYGSCVAWSTGYAFASFYFSVKNKWGKPEDQSKIMSPAYIYNSIRECNCGPSCGTYITDALDLLKTKGVVPWQSMPYNDKSCNMPASNLHNVASHYKIKGYNRLLNKLNFNEYKQYLSNDVPVIIGVPLGKGFDNYSPAAGSTFKCTQLTSGGHAMLLVGYDDNRKAFKIMNSWGKDWGDKGHIWVDYDCFKLMMSGNGGEAYVVSKDYEIPNSNNPVIDPTPSPDDNTNLVLTDELFIPFGYSEEIETDHFYIAYGILLDPSIQNEIDRVVYVFDDPDFANKYVTSKEAPYFSTAYEGPFCLEEIQAYIYLKNGARHVITFDGCEVLNYNDEEGDDETDEGDDEESGYIVVTPIVKATPVASKPGTYTFEIRLRGLDPIKEHIEKVVYNYNHSSFSNPYVTVSDSSNGYKTSYNGWGCLNALIATIYYTDGTTDSIEIDMCTELGW